MLNFNFQLLSATTLVCFALHQEAAPFRRLAAARSGLRILVTGVGRQNAERVLQAALAQAKPGLVLSCGYAGGLDPALALGTVLFAADEGSNLREDLLASGATPARFCCSARMAVTAADKQALRLSSGADAVEMESEVIRQLCRDHQVPCATLRVISDTATENLPLDFNQFMTKSQELDYGKLAWKLIRSPKTLFALLRLRRQCRAAAQRLAETLTRFLALENPAQEVEDATSRP